LTELRFDDRVAVVTGAGRGVGRAYALLLAPKGAGCWSPSQGLAKDDLTAEDIADNIETVMDLTTTFAVEIPS
jgi:NAD(P)-dependent dehydrogenase (short-subunit alcohol dehydrogenase family)